MRYRGIRRLVLDLRGDVRGQLREVSAHVYGHMGVQTAGREDSAYDAAREVERLRCLDAGLTWYLARAGARGEA